MEKHSASLPAMSGMVYKQSIATLPCIVKAESLQQRQVSWLVTAWPSFSLSVESNGHGCGNAFALLTVARLPVICTRFLINPPGRNPY